MPSQPPGRPIKVSAPRESSPVPEAGEPADLGPSGPRVSVILVAYNQEAELRRALSALQTSGENTALEILAVDCGSSDGTAQLDNEFPAVQILRLPQHFGATRALNIAMRTAKGELLCFLSPLVEIQPETLMALADRLDADSSAAAVCPLLSDPSGQPMATAYRIPSAEDFAAARLRVMPVDAGEDSVAVEYARRDALLVRKQFILGINYFDERFGEYWADLDLCMRIRRAGKKIRVIPSLRATVHPGPDPLRDLPLAEADRMVGAAAFIGKYDGGFAGFKFKLAAILHALLAFNFKRFGRLISGEHMGSQAGR